ncbi:unnamed protein product [Fraxinus pennsylvanica]|uniref:Uncharacterized protein n=1 Tax=Fraxinus pennsylvanica TaxID=56036 RepID=A0AAD1YML8_9LAMI|nr:unnamed protein product [Fraxinus pennsylvanica]
MIEFELYYETFLDRWISTIEPKLEPEEEPYYESDSELGDESRYVPGPEADAEHEPVFELDPELGDDQEFEPESCISSDDEAPPSKLRRIQNDGTSEDED